MTVRPHIRATPFGLPGILSEIAAVTSIEVALKVACAFGGIELYIRRKPGDDHPLALAVGLEVATIIGGHFGGGARKIPSAKPYRRWREVHRLRDEGKSVAEIAAAVDLGKRYVYRLLEGHAATPPSADSDGASIERKAAP